MNGQPGVRTHRTSKTTSISHEELVYGRDSYFTANNRRVSPLMADVVSTYVARSFASIIRRPNELFRGMARHPELCCLMLAFVITLVIKYGSSFKGKPVTVPAKQPQYMFAPATLVLDSPRGSLMPLIQILNQEELVFVMYYAPWCSKSQSARTEFIKAANYFNGEVKFAAVNCWWPEGECRKRYKFLLYPVFMVYHTKLDGYRYFGVTRAEQMIRFVENLLIPLTVVHTKMETIEMVAKYDTVVLGYFNLSLLENMGAYRQFYYASMRILEKDPIQPIKFLIVTHSDLATTFNLAHFEDIIMLRLTNTSLTYPFVNNVTSSNLISWVLQNKDLKTVKRLSPEGVKSQALATEIDKGPAFIMFHVENPLFDIEPGYRVLKDIALLYRKCIIQPAFGDIRAIWADGRNNQVQKYQLFAQMCEQSKLSLQHARYTLPCCISALVHSINASSKVCNICRQESNVCSIPPDHLSSALNRSHPLPLSCCRNVVLNYLSEKLSVCCRLRNESSENDIQWIQNFGGDMRNSSNEIKNISYAKNRTIANSQNRRPTDRYVRHHLENLPRRLCDRLAVEKHQGLKSVWTSDCEPEDSDMERKEQHFTHVGCTSNKSLNFYAIDSQNHWMFYDVLGMKPFISLGRPTAVLFDKVNEEHYIMKESFTLSNTMSFIMDFEQGKLKRHKQSHNFQHMDCDQQGHVCVKELNSESFLDVVMEENIDVVVLVYAHWCGFCQALSHTFLTLAEYFSSSKYITFVRINGATNDLPWEYTFDFYPTVLFFPARRKADSAIFPVKRDTTLVNLIHFVLQHATFDTKLHLASDVCSKNCIQQNLKRSISLLQMLQHKQTYLQTKLLQLSEENHLPEPVMEDSTREDYYGKLSTDFFSNRLKDTQSKIEHVTKLIEYLKVHEGTVISKQELVDLFSQEKTSSGA